MPPVADRRRFLRTSAATVIGAWVTSRRAAGQPASANDRLNIAGIGVGNRGVPDVAGVATENIAALCDIDDTYLGEASKKYPQASLYHDFRKLLETEKGLDAVVIATADHTHAPAAAMAMKLGKHVYCEKPLTHSIHEARVLADLAAKTGAVTQMGNNGHAGEKLRRNVEILMAGAIGPVREVHAWTDRPGRWWPQGLDRPAETPAAPAHLHWDEWLGPAPARPYNPCYHPGRWRGWWDFGSGALGDMACHVLDCAYWALDLRAPSAAEAEGGPRKPETGPDGAVFRWEFPARGAHPPLKLFWYEGGKHPPEALAGLSDWPENGTIFVGDKGTFVLLDAYGGQYRLLPEKDFSGFQPPKPTLPRPDQGNHHQEWVRACKTKGTPGSNFAYAGPFTEMVLVGVLAYRLGRRIEWDARNLRVPGCPEADPLIRRDYRKGWTL